MVKRIGIELGRALLSAVMLVALTWAGVSVASSVSGGGFSGSIGNATGTQLTLTQGISAATGLFSGNITMSGTSATGLLRVNPSGSTTNGVWIVAQGTAEALYAESANNASSQACQCAGISNGNGVLATGTGSGAALTATNTSGGLPVVINGDTTSPAVGQIRMPVLDTNPTSCQVGDVFMFTGGILRVCTATTPTWVNVGSQ